MISISACGWDGKPVFGAISSSFQTRKAWWYFPRPLLGFDGGKGDQGASHFIAPNPPFGAVFTYNLRQDLQTAKQARQEREKAAVENDDAVEFPGWDTVEDEPVSYTHLTLPTTPYV